RAVRVHRDRRGDWRPLRGRLRHRARASAGPGQPRGKPALRPITTRITIPMAALRSPLVIFIGAPSGHPHAVKASYFVVPRRPDTIAVFAIRPAGNDIGGYGGSSPRGKTDADDMEF